MPSILTSDVWDDYLYDETRQRSDLQSRVETAEAWVISYFEQHRAGDSSMYFSDTAGSEIVTLEGWEEDSSGNPDPTAMPDALVSLLRRAIADVVEHDIEAGGRDDVSSISQGDKSVSYETSPSLDSRALKVLENRFDYSDPFCGRW